MSEPNLERRIEKNEFRIDADLHRLNRLETKVSHMDIKLEIYEEFIFNLINNLKDFGEKIKKI